MSTNYNYEKDSLTRFGSYEKYNRVLYGGHENDSQWGRFFTFAGDTPAFLGSSSDFTKDTWCYQAKNGHLFSGMALTEGFSMMMGSHDNFSGWFHDASDLTAAWHHGYMTYDFTRFSPYFPDAKIRLEVYPLNPGDGFVVSYDITLDQRAIFCAGFGGITPFFGRFEYHTSDRKDFSPEDCQDNTAEITGCGAAVHGPLDTTMRIAADFDCEYELDNPDALAETYPAQFLMNHDGNHKCIVKIRRALNPGEHFTGKLIVLRNGTEEQLKSLLAEKNLCGRLRAAIRRKYAAVSCHTPDTGLNDSFTDIIIAQDASFHGNTFYHGAIGYHAPFLGWRGWYAPVLLGWYDRVRKAIESHFNTITRFDGEEKVWWDGADRPDLDHEGTQYSHLQNSSGHLTALLHRDDIYDMQEVAIDMTLYYLESTADDDTAKDIFSRLAELLDWEERIMDFDNDGLYQNFLNTWISDGHCYNGAGCAQASAYNYAANVRAAAIGRRLGLDVSKMEARAAKIREAMQKKLWLPETGVMAESLDTLGNCLIHPSPELSTTYLAIDCNTVSSDQAWRMLKWTERNITSKRTIGRGGRLYYCSNWLPKKYSTYGIFPAENACLALAYYQNRQPEKAFEILNGLADAFALSPHPGSITHVLSATGGTDDGDIDFTDVSSCYLRLLLEGLWGVRWNHAENATVAPQLPESWRQASLSLPYLTMTLDRTDFTDCYTMAINDGTAVNFIVPMRYAEIDQIFVNGEPAEFRITPGIGRSYAELPALPAGKYDIKIYYNDVPFPTLLQASLVTVAGGTVVAKVQNGTWDDCQDDCAIAAEIIEANDGRIIRLADAKPGKYDLLIKSGHVILPCEIAVEAPKAVALPELKPDQSCRQLDLSALFNQSVTEIHNQKFCDPRPTGYSIGMRLNGRYAWEWNHYGHNAVHVDDSILRRNSVFNGPDGWQFAVPTAGKNALSVSLWKQFPTVASIPLNGNARALAILFCGTTNAMQLYVPNGKFEAVYEDGTAETVVLVPPVNFDDFLIPVYEQGNPAAYIGEGTHALVQVIRLNPAKNLKELRVTAIANEAIINILGITVLPA